MNPFHRFVILGLALPLCLQLAGCNKSPGDHMALAKAAIQAKDSVAAVLHLKNLLAKEPNNAEVRVMLGETMLNAGDPGGAVIELKRARELKADENRVVPLLAEALLGSGNMRLLLEQFGSARLSSPEAAAELAGTLAMANIMLKRPEKAREVVEAALKVAPTSRTVRLALARVFVAEAKPTEAMNTLEALLRDAPNFDEAWSLKGLLLQSTDAERALEAYAKALQIDPRQLEALYSTAMIQLSRGDLKAARATQGKLAQAWPRNLNSLYVEVVDLQRRRVQVACAQRQFAVPVKRIGPTQTLLAVGANILPEEREDGRLVRLQHVHPAQHQGAADEQQHHHQQARQTQRQLRRQQGQARQHGEDADGGHDIAVARASGGFMAPRLICHVRLRRHQSDITVMSFLTRVNRQSRAGSGWCFPADAVRMLLGGLVVRGLSAILKPASPDRCSRRGLRLLSTT